MNTQLMQKLKDGTDKDEKFFRTQLLEKVKNENNRIVVVYVPGDTFLVLDVLLSKQLFASFLGIFTPCVVKFMTPFYNAKFFLAHSIVAYLHGFLSWYIELFFFLFLFLLTWF